MLATFIIVFREVIEAALVIGIVLAAARGVPRRTVFVALGVLAGVLGACVVAAFASSIGNALAGVGQEVFNAGVLLVAVVMLAWHNIWMAQHGREMAAEAKALGRSVASGERSLTALAVVVGAAVLREGSEVVLFLYGVAVQGSETLAAMLLGGALGLAAGAAAGALIYAGLLSIPARHIFSVTSTLIALLAAGMAAQAANFLQQAGVVESDLLARTAWDTSGVLADSSLSGRVLHTLVGYVDQPSLLQLAVYLATLALILGLTRARRPAGRPPAAPGTGSAAAASAARAASGPSAPLPTR